MNLFDKFLGSLIIHEHRRSAPMRIHNLSLPNANDFSMLYRHPDIDAVTLMLHKQGTVFLFILIYSFKN